MAGKTRDIHLTAGAGGRAVLILPPHARLWPVAHQTLGRGRARWPVLADEAFSDLAPIVASFRAGVLNGVGHSRNDDAQRVDAPGWYRSHQVGCLGLKFRSSVGLRPSSPPAKRPVGEPGRRHPEAGVTGVEVSRDQQVVDSSRVDRCVPGRPGSPVSRHPLPSHL